VKASPRIDAHLPFGASATGVVAVGRRADYPLRSAHCATGRVIAKAPPTDETGVLGLSLVTV
jgi:hypothetical protein